jgi:phosphate transport system permease protein
MERTAFSLAPTRQLRRRKLVSKVMEASMLVAALAAVGVLALVVVSVVQRGYSALSTDFFTKGPETSFLAQGIGGIANAIIGTLVIVAVATLLSLPLGVLIAVYTREFARPRVRRAIGFTLDVINGLPSIVIGIFVFGLLVLGHQQSAYAGGAALAILMLPLIARSTQEVLALVPDSLREASFALGVSRWRTVVGVMLPASFGGVLTGATLAIGRAAGETAPLLFTCALTTSAISWNPGQALQSIPLTIFEDLERPEPAYHAQAWAAAMVLMSAVLVISIVSKAALARSRRKLSR